MGHPARACHQPPRAARTRCAHRARRRAARRADRPVPASSRREARRERWREGLCRAEPRKVAAAARLDLRDLVGRGQHHPEAVVGASTRRHDVEVRFSSPISARQPDFVTSKCSALKTSAGPWAGYRSTQWSSASCGGAGPGGSVGVSLDPQPVSKVTAARTRSTVRAGGIGACSHTPFGSLRRRVDLYEHQGKELSARPGSRSRRGGSPRPPPRRARGRRGARRPGRRQGAGPHRRTWQGRRDQARGRPGRGGGPCR